MTASNDQSHDRPTDDACRALQRGTPAWIRAVADGEIPEPADLTADLTDGETRAIAFERELRSRTAAVFTASGGVRTPEGLRARILAAVEHDRAMDANAEAASSSVPERLATQTSSPSFWASPRKWAPLAAAAAVLLVGGVYLSSGVFSANGSGSQIELSTAGFDPQMAQYITREHQNACERSADVVKNFRFTDASTAIQQVSDFLGKTLCIKRMPGTMGCTAPIAYEGGETAQIPGTEKSLHLLMRLEGAGDAETTTASLFVMPQPEGLSLDPAVTYELNPGKYHCEGYRVAVWASNGLVYTLVTRAEAEAARDTVLSAMYRPAPSADL